MAATGLWNRQFSFGESFAVTPRQIVYAVAVGVVVLANADECECDATGVLKDPNKNGGWGPGFSSDTLDVTTPNAVEGPTDVPVYFVPYRESLPPVVAVGK